MSATALIFLAVYFTGLILTFRNPVFGVMTYLFEWHNSPPYWWWGNEVPDLRWSFTIAIATLISWFLHRKRINPLEGAEYKAAIWFVLLVIDSYLVSASFALVPDESFAKSEILMKYCINFILMTQVIRKPKDYRLLIWVILIGTANFGKIAWEEGSNRNLHVLAPSATEENAVSAYVASILPFFMFYFFTGNRWQKIFIGLAVPFCLNLIILANSRAAFVSMLVIGLFTLLWTRGKMRLKVIAGMALAVIVFLNLTNEQFWSRQQTIERYQEEGSAVSRIYLWHGGLRMMNDYPMGVGGEGFELLAQIYVPEEAEYMQRKGNNITVHNTFLNIGTEWGVLGLIFFVGMLMHCAIYLRRVKKIARRFPSLSRFYFEATAIQLSLLGILTAGVFHNQSYAEVLYWLCAFSIMLRNIVVNEVKQIQMNGHADAQALQDIEKIPVGEIPTL